MDKVRRKMVHEIAGKFGVKSNSSGSGTNRYITFVKTSRTLAFDDEAFAEVSKTVKWGFFPRSGAPRGPGGKSTGKAQARTPGDAGVTYRDGEVVGAAAPEIGTDNRGRSMLEKMGWRAGTALGAVDNKGILQPITHVVKNTRAGLG
jgi:G-patch domain/R3H domain